MTAGSPDLAPARLSAGNLEPAALAAGSPKPDLTPRSARIPEPDLTPRSARIPEPDLTALNASSPEPDLTPLSAEPPEPDLTPLNASSPEPAQPHSPRDPGAGPARRGAVGHAGTLATASATDFTRSTVRGPQREAMSSSRA
ncbi:hypothetical protein CLV67_12686 [Actinoplanes italicus]|uniref:Uncharacterized protein n=1 Tax=Actinoplanes italicus TaxID=113567 RepID=A0A2T0JY91_9ACTN|nr:hypothetical protein CLV67_12686 [Actinoplanes italicus]